jgi:hypothetical protein
LRQNAVPITHIVNRHGGARLAPCSSIFLKIILETLAAAWRRNSGHHQPPKKLFQKLGFPNDACASILKK